ncbi:MAG: PAS domain-containing protein [Myxococcota bacterium]
MADRRGTGGRNLEDRTTRAVLEAVSVGVVVFRSDGEITYANAMAERILSLRADEMAGMHPADPMWKMIAEDGTPITGGEHPSMVTLRTGEPVRDAICGVYGDDPSRVRWLLINTHPVLEEGQSRPSGVVVSFNDISQLKRAQEELKQSEENYRTLAENSLDIIMRFDRELRHTFVSPAIERVWHMDAAAFLGKTHRELGLPEAMCAFFEDPIERVLRTGEPETHEFDYDLASGPSRWEWRLTPERDSEGHVRSVVTFARDVTDRNRAEQEWRKLADVVKNMPVGLQLYQLEEPDDDASLRLIATNPAAEALTGVPAGSVVGKRIDDAFPAGFGAQLRALYAGVARSGSEAEQVVTVEEPGGTKSCSIKAFALPHRGVGVFLEDVTDKQHAKAMLEESRETATEIIQSTPSGLFIYQFEEPDQLILVDANPAAERSTSIRLSEWQGRTFDEIWPAAAEAGLTAKLVDVVRTGEVLRTEGFRYVDSRLTGFYSLTGFRMPKNRLGVAFEDVTEQHRAAEEKAQLEAHLRHAQRLEAVGRLAGGIAHDFNNLLTAIAGNTTLALQELSPEDNLYQSLSDVMRAVDRASTLTRQLLAYGRKQIMEPRVVDPTELLAGLRKILARVIGEAIAFEIRCAPTTGNVHVDPGQLEQVLINLVINARDAMPNGGELTIETDTVRVDQHSGPVSADLEPGSYLLISVRDTGVGMPKEILERAFEPFFTTKTEARGSGLGLATAHGIIRQHEGTIDVESMVGDGATFRIYLPRVDRAPDQFGALATKKDASRGTECVLVVEDEPSVRNVAVQSLRRAGYQVFEAGCGSDAIALLEREKTRVDLLLTDVIMPGMNGKQLAEEVMARQPHVRVLYTSGYAEDVVVHHGVIEEDLDFLAKPYMPSALAQRVRQLLDRAKKGR